MVRTLRAIAFMVVLAPTALAQGIQPGDDDATSRMQGLVDKLRRITDQAERDRLADFRLLNDLRSLIRDYENQWGFRVLGDDFRDGDYTRSPAWTVASGEFWIDWNHGLTSWIKPQATPPAPVGRGGQEDLAGAIIGGLLGQLARPPGGQQQSAPAQAADRAEIFVPAKLTNAFAVSIEMVLRQGGGRILLGPYRGAQRNQGYRLAYTAGAQHAVELLRVTPTGVAVVDTATEPVSFGDYLPHRLDWTRDGQGEMVVRFDGRDVIRTLDRGFRDDFDGFVVTNVGGNYSIREVTLSGTRRLP